MDRETAKHYIRERAAEYLQPDRSGKGYICPVCGSGSGSKGTGITTKDGIHFTCWTGCFTNSDIIDIIGIERGLTDYNERIHAASEIYKITLDENQPGVEDYRPKRTTQPSIHNSVYTYTHTQPEAADTDYTEFFLQANRDIELTDYHRGISLETLNRFKVGFVKEWRRPLELYLAGGTPDKPRTRESWERIPKTPRLIIPTSRYSYLARDTRTELPEGQEGFTKMKVGNTHIFNYKALQTATKPIFIVEGELDALSIIDVGGEAVALGSIGNTGKFLRLLESDKPSQPFIIALDNEKDPAKQEKVAAAVKVLQDGLEKLGISFYKINPYGEHKDANEALNGNREAFKAAIIEAESVEAQALEAERGKLQKEAAAYSLNSFMREIEASKTAAFTPTGFDSLDTLLEGGFYSGLYIVGAISSLGKTTFCLQIADQIAQAGKKVLVFSLEMARNELIAKSVSRLTFLEDKSRNDTTTHAKTTRGILTGSRYCNYSEDEKRLILTVIKQYGEYAENIWITEGIGDITVNSIREKVKQFITLYGEAPVVVIDYIQILAPYSEKYSDKQNTDKAVLELKRLSRDYRLPIIGVSSFNRESYTAPVNLACFKESGAIEYTADVLIGLQYLGMDFQEGEADKVREKRIRELMKKAIEDGKSGKAQTIQVKVLKNRNGSKGDALLDFFPMFNCFAERKTTQTEDGDGWHKIGEPRAEPVTEETPSGAGSWDGFKEIEDDTLEELPF